MSLVIRVKNNVAWITIHHLNKLWNLLCLCYHMWRWCGCIWHDERMKWILHSRVGNQVRLEFKWHPHSGHYQTLKRQCQNHLRGKAVEVGEALSLKWRYWYPHLLSWTSTPRMILNSLSSSFQSRSRPRWNLTQPWSVVSPRRGQSKSNWYERHQARGRNVNLPTLSESNVKSPSRRRT